MKLRVLAPGAIEQAKRDWRAGPFLLVPDDVAEFIRIPDQPMTMSYP